MAPVPCASIVIPCYDEAPTIKAVLERVLASPYTAEVIVVDDGSTDGSAALARSVDDPRVRVFEHGLNIGKGACLRRAFREVTAPYVIVQDADLEYDPAIYKQLLEPLFDDADVVFGSRFAPQPHRVLYFRHSLANKCITFLSDGVTNLNLSDVMSGAKAFRHEVLESIEVEQDRFGVEPELVAKVAAGRWRVFEVGIPYEGRSYAEGKKATWTAAIGSLLAVFRYSRLGTRLAKPRETFEAVTFSSADVELAEALDSLDDAGNYADWIVELIAPHLGPRVLEVGAGHGTMSVRLRDLAASLTATELSARSADLLRERFAGDPKVSVVEGDIATAAAHGPFDSAVMVNVLEHIPDDIGALRDLHDAIAPGGTAAIYVPAYEVLYSDFDRRIGHCRRYRRSTIVQALTTAGFEMVSVRYLSLPGALAWLVVARLLGRQPTNPRIAGLYDRVAIPVLRRVEARWEMPAGQSLLAIARRPLEAAD
ncbi:MAG: glycosyltransferase [Actinobacteria bacterium]|nr:glycosyltransferase [Actinomycetota bacterium]